MNQPIGLRSNDLTEDSTGCIDTIHLMSHYAAACRRPNSDSIHQLIVPTWCPWHIMPSRIGRYQGGSRVGDAIIFLGSDPRLELEIAIGRDDALHFKAPADGRRVALYGPYITLPPGHFRLELTFAVDELAPGEVTIELCHTQARQKVYVRSCFPWELTAGLIRVSYPFTEGVRELEVRLIVPPGFSGSIKQLSFNARD